MKILVTGAQGFIGSHLSARLRQAGFNVVDFDLATGQNILFCADVESAISDSVRIVYHIAAQSDLTAIKSLDDAVATTELNVIGTHIIASACAKYKAWLIYVSTCCVYGNQYTYPIDEDIALPRPTELYASSKLAGEEVVRGYGQTFAMPYTILRAATVYGPNMRPALATHIFIAQALKNSPLTIHGTGKQTRMQIYIDDLIEALARVQRCPEAQGQIINLAGPESISVIQLATAIKTILRSSSSIVYTPDRPHQILREDVNTRKASLLLEHWKPMTRLTDGLPKTIRWYEQKCLRSEILTPY